MSGSWLKQGLQPVQQRLCLPFFCVRYTNIHTFLKTCVHTVTHNCRNMHAHTHPHACSFSISWCYFSEWAVTSPRNTLEKNLFTILSDDWFPDAWVDPYDLCPVLKEDLYSSLLIKIQPVVNNCSPLDAVPFLSILHRDIESMVHEKHNNAVLIWLVDAVYLTVIRATFDEHQSVLKGKPECFWLL